MSLMDAMLLEGYRDPREVYIAVRTDGLKGSGTIDDPYDGGTRPDVPLSGTINFDRKEIVGVTTGAAHGLADGGSVTISNVNGQSASAYNGPHSPVTTIDSYAFKVPLGTTPADPPGPGLPIDNLYVLANSVIIRLYWPVMKVTLPTGHGINNYDVVRISGSSESLLNGDFVVVATGGNLAWCMVTSLPANNFSGSCNCAKVVHRFDALLRTNADGSTVVPASSIIHIGPGIFETRGWSNLFFTDYPANQSRSNVGWQPRTGMKLRGSGIDVTVLKLVHATNPLAQCSIIENSSAIDMAHFEAGDFTMDCNIDGQPRFDDGLPVKAPARVTCGGTNIRGDFTRLKRLRAINWGCQSVPETFVIRVTGNGGDKRGSILGIGNIVEECIMEKPGSANTHESTLSNYGGDSDTAGALSCALRNNYCNTDYTDPNDPTKTISAEIIAVASTSVNGSSPQTSGPFTIATSRPHNLKVGDSFILNGVQRKVGAYFVNDDIQTTNPYVSHHTRSYRVTDVFGPLPSTSFETEVLTDYSQPTGYEIDLSSAYIGPQFQGPSVAAGSGCVIEGNRQFGWQIGCYQDTGSSRDLVIRDNYWSNVWVGFFLNMGSAGLLRPANGISVSGTEVTISTPASSATIRPHELQPGYAVDVFGVTGSEHDAGLVNGTHTVKRVTTVDPTASFTFDITEGLQGSVGGGAITFRHRWQTRRLFLENNVIDVSRRDNFSVGGSQEIKSRPVGLSLYSLGLIYPTGYSANNDLQPAYIFSNTIIRDNVIGYYHGGTDSLMNLGIAIAMVGGDSVLVDGNVINLNAVISNVDSRILVNSTKDFGNRNNLAADGEVIPTASNNTYPPVAVPDGYADIADAILSSLILSL